MALTWTDWRGHDYTVGDMILYARSSGRCVELAEGQVVDLFEVMYQKGTWVRMEEGAEPPMEEVWGWIDSETQEHSRYYKGEGWLRARVTVPVEVKRRARILPTNRTSRFGGYWNKKWTYDEATGKGEFVKTEQKPITLSVTESITAIVL